MSVQSQIDRIEQNVANTYNALESVGADMPNTQNTDNLPETVLTIKAVRYDEQTLTDEQKAQARENIGAVGAFDPIVYGLPVLYLTGDTTGMSKENKVTMNYVYGDLSGTCTQKWQGSSSIAYEKKNYTIVFDTAFEAFSGWGAQKKYCFKANFIDTTHARNVVTAKLWGQMAKSRSDVPTEWTELPNAGAVDGFPCIIMLNEEFHGLYTWNIPKDGWMFGLEEDITRTQAIICANKETDAVRFKSEAKLDGTDFEIEFISNETNTAWARNSLNRLITACMNTNGSDLDTTIARYLDWNSAIDHYILTVLLGGSDILDKNFLLVSLDGEKWYFSAYDLDTTYGLKWDGSGLRAYDYALSFTECAKLHRVYELIKRFKTDALKARYEQLRSNIWSEPNVVLAFENFAWDIPTPVMVEDVKKYPSILGSSVNGIDQLCRWVHGRLEIVDKWANALPAQETPPEPEEPEEPDVPDTPAYTNRVPLSIDTDMTIYNGVGYKEKCRLSSSGEEKGADYSTAFGYIPVVGGDTIRLKVLGVNGNTVIWADGTTSGNYICVYKSDFTFLYAGNAKSTYSTTTFVESMTNDGVISTIKLKDVADIAYMRMNVKDETNIMGVDGTTAIITVNEEIT